ncbi:MAG TPA: hypothetical protein VFM80_02900 [Gracilimonas sp.]|uniref:hypothetical protein n=1 Tax=Gracilimonas sp. TaxID=1974203 RepID=UPI002DA91F1D|nr:hypothetical protein [Gracilimonas sp.]
MQLFNRKENDWVEAKIEQATKEDFARIKSSDEFLFDWTKERKRSVFKMLEVSTGNILGLISVTDFQEELRLHINLLESSKSNVGKNKVIDGIAGSLIAHVVSKAFENGYNGFVSLIPKTNLIEYYIKMYGFIRVGNALVIEGEQSIKLIKKHYKS